MRVVVERWDDDYIWATEEINNSTLKICYGKDNRILTREGKFDWGYLKDALWDGAQLNLVRLRKDDRGEIYYPELKLCTDNAAMIASAGYYNYLAGNLSDFTLNAVPNLKL